jgi:hypothetical protein
MTPCSSGLSDLTADERLGERARVERVEVERLGMHCASRNRLAVEVRAALGVDVGDALLGECAQTFGEQKRRERLAASWGAVEAHLECCLLCFCFPESGHAILLE